MDMLAAYGSDSGSECEDFDVAGGNATTAQNTQGTSDHEPPIKRARLESCRHGNGSKAESAEQTATPTAASAAGASEVVQQQHGLSDTEPARARSFPFVEGEWPTVVYVPVPDNCVQQLQQLAAALIAQCPEVPAAPFQPSAGTAAGTAADTGITTAADTGINSAVCSAETSLAHSSNAAPGIAAAASSSTLRLWPTTPLPSQSNNIVNHNNSSSSIPTQQSLLQQQQQQQGQQQLQQDQQQDQHQDQQLQLHMSISRTLPIKYIQIASLKAALSKQLKGFRPFRINLQGLACLVNDAGTRTFVCIKVAKGHQQVVRLLGAVDRAFVTHGLETFYQEPLPHVSLAWAPGDQRHLLQPWLESFEHESINMLVSQAECQTGKIRTTVWKP